MIKIRGDEKCVDTENMSVYLFAGGIVRKNCICKGCGGGACTEPGREYGKYRIRFGRVLAGPGGFGNGNRRLDDFSRQGG